MQLPLYKQILVLIALYWAQVLPNIASKVFSLYLGTFVEVLLIFLYCQLLLGIILVLPPHFWGFWASTAADLIVPKVPGS